MLKIYSTDKQAFVQKNSARDENAVLLADPASFINHTLLKQSIIPYSIMPISANIKQMVQKFDKIQKFKLEGEISECLLNVLTIPRYNNLDKIFEKAELALKNNNDVYATLTGAVLFIEWLHNKKSIIEDIDCDIPLDEMEESFLSIKNKVFYPVALERLLKMLAMFYGKKIPKTINYKISNFQVNLLAIENSEDVNEKLNLISENDIDVLFDYIETLKNEVALNSINIFNKILEELIILKRIILSEQIEFKKEPFTEIKSGNTDNQFIDMYVEVLS